MVCKAKTLWLNCVKVYWIWKTHRQEYTKFTGFWRKLCWIACYSNTDSAVSKVLTAETRGFSPYRSETRGFSKNSVGVGTGAELEWEQSFHLWVRRKPPTFAKPCSEGQGELLPGGEGAEEEPQTEGAAQSKLRAHIFGLKNCSRSSYWATYLWLYGWKLRTVRPLERLNKFHKKIKTNLEDAEAGVAMSDVGFQLIVHHTTHYNTKADNTVQLCFFVKLQISCKAKTL